MRKQEVIAESFVLSETILNELISEMGDCFSADHESTQFDCIIKTIKGKNTDVEAIKIESPWLNSIKYIYNKLNRRDEPITEITMIFKNHINGNYNHCEIDFSHCNIECIVTSEDDRWSRDILGKMKTHLRRASKRSSLYTNISEFAAYRRLIHIFMMLYILMIGVLISMSFSKYMTRSDHPSVYNMWLSVDDVNQIEDEFRKIKNSAPRDEISILNSQELLLSIYHKQILNMSAFRNSGGVIRIIGMNEWSFWTIMLPWLALMSAVYYLLSHCYPGAVFDWGDHKEVYDEIEKRRSQVWWGIIIAMLVGLLVNVATIGLPH